MKQILEKYNNSPAKLNNQYMYLGQTLIAVILMQGQSMESSERILNYVLSR